ncbi:hypothetical protein [Parasitella parasitica]|uniref:Uncharacterized protein n=1 Tax=Parasitella parasitica TaxID=35722 RepID=A0A0B7NG42_9FUNG|nr:hypothetical protein [Parasitella parasitica]
MTDNTGPSWATVLSRGLSKKVINTQTRRAVKAAKYQLVTEVLFENEDLKAEILTRKATAIIENAVDPNAVLFTFPKQTIDEFDHYVDVYVAISEQLGTTKVQYRPLGLWHHRQDGEFLLQATFESKEVALKAINDGVIFKEVVYKATAVKVTTPGRLPLVNMTIVNTPNMDTFLGDLMESMRY